MKCRGTSEIYYKDQTYYPNCEGNRDIFVLPIEDFNLHLLTIAYYMTEKPDGWDFNGKTKDNFFKALRYGYIHYSLKAEMKIHGKKEGVIKLSIDDTCVKYGLFSLTYPEFKILNDPKNVIEKYTIAYFPSSIIRKLTYCLWIARAMIIWAIVELLCGAWIFAIVSPESGILTWEQYKIQLLIGVPIIAIGITIIVIQDIALIKRFLALTQHQQLETD